MSASGDAGLPAAVWGVIDRIACIEEGFSVLSARGTGLRASSRNHHLSIHLPSIDFSEAIDEANLLRAASAREVFSSGQRFIIAARGGSSTLLLDAGFTVWSETGETISQSYSGFVVLSGINALALAAAWTDPSTFVEFPCKVHVLGSGWWASTAPAIIDPFATSPLPGDLFQADVESEPAAAGGPVAAVSRELEEAAAARVQLFLRVVRNSGSLGEDLPQPASRPPEALVEMGRRASVLLRWVEQSV